MAKKTDIISITTHLKNESIFLNQVVPQRKKLIVVVQPDSCITLYEHDRVDELIFFLGANSRLNFFSLITKPGTKKIELNCMGKHSKANVQSFYLLDGNKNVSLHTKQNHVAPHSHTDMQLRGLVTDNAQLIHHGNVFVEKNAQHCTATQKNKTIPLSTDAKIESSPCLEVHNKQVRCTHGSAVGQLDEQQLLYLRSRGLTKKEATRLLLEAFFALPFAGGDAKNQNSTCFGQCSDFFLKRYRRWYERVA